MSNTSVQDCSDVRASSEAAAWLSRLQQQDISDETREGFQAWLRESEANRQAFENATLIWDILPGAVREGTSAELLKARRLLNIGRAAAASVVFLLVGLFAAYQHFAAAVYETAKGQQETVMLTDGSRVSLNTNSRVEIAFDRHTRRVKLVRGEAMFEVAKNDKLPFVVALGENQVRALGTTFILRKDERLVSATLLEGRLEVSEVQERNSVRLAILEPGQRIKIAEGAEPAIDYPSLKAMTAWRRGEVMFDNELLENAAKELNRYSDLLLEVTDPKLATLRISGVFTTRDAQEFAHTVAALYGLHLERSQNLVRFVQND